MNISRQSVSLLRRSAVLTVALVLRPAVTGAGAAAPPDHAVAVESSATLAGQVDVARLIDLCAQRLHLNIEYDAAQVKGTVTLRLEAPLSDDELWLLTNRALATRGFTTIRQVGKDAYSVVRLADAPAAAVVDVPIPGGEAAATPAGPAPGFQSIVLRARHRAAKDLAEQLTKALARPGAAAGAAGSVTPLGDSGLLLVSDLSSRIEQTVALLNLLDTPGSRTSIEEIPAANLPASQLAALVSQLAAKRDAVSGEKLPGELVASPDGSGLLLVAPAGASEQWRSLIAALDKREPVETATYTPRHFAPKDVARLIEQTVRGGGGGGGGTAPGGPVGAGTSTVGTDRLRVVIDELTSSLIITATPAQHEQIRALIERLDSAPAVARRPVRTYTIKNRSVTEVEGVLRELLRAGVLEAGSGDEPAGGPASSPVSGLGAAESPAPGAATTTALPPPPARTAHGTPSQPANSPPPGTSAPVPRPSVSLSGRPAVTASTTATASASDPVTLTTDKQTNTLIAVGEPRVLDQIEALLKTLDVRQPQVMLEVLLVTLTQGQTLDLGVELEKLSVNGDIRTRVSSLFGLGSRTGGGDRTGPDSAAGFTGVVLSPGDFSVVVRALETLNSGRAVSMPRLLVGNNEQATLDSVVQQPYASVNASNTVSTTSFGGTQDAGTVVTIQPQIGEGEHLMLQYSVSLSSFLGTASSPTLPPARQQNRVQSVASIPDGYTVVVGGIELENKSETVSQLPVLGNIPILGEAFKSRSNANNRSRFYVFIRASILRRNGFEDLKYLSEREVADAKVEDNWPEVRPRVIK